MAGVRVRQLSERETAMLAFERGWWRHRGAKEAAVREAFGLSATAWAQQLNCLLDDPSAFAADPVTVRRLVALRDRRRRQVGSPRGAFGGVGSG